jgi:hypothetical protein
MIYKGTDAQHLVIIQPNKIASANVTERWAKSKIIINCKADEVSDDESQDSFIIIKIS